jgi:hypothetical protein
MPRVMLLLELLFMSGIRLDPAEVSASVIQLCENDAISLCTLYSFLFLIVFHMLWSHITFL